MLRPKSKAERKQMQELIMSAFELNYGQILSFLSESEQRTVKLSIHVFIQFAEASITSVSPPKFGLE